jgi:hypothetical protein
LKNANNPPTIMIVEEMLEISLGKPTLTEP